MGRTQGTRPAIRKKIGRLALTSMLRYFSPILVPIPFALVIFFFSLIASSRGIANLAPLPLAIILLTLVVIQGAFLYYYAGNSDTLWTLSIVGGYMLFLLVDVFVFFGLNGALIVGGAFLVLFVLVSIVFGRQRRKDKAEQDRFKDEATAARRQAPAAARRIAEESQRRQAQLYSASPPQAQLPEIQAQPGNINQSLNKPMQPQTPQIHNITPADNMRDQELQANLDYLAIQARLQRLWDQADN